MQDIFVSSIYRLRVCSEVDDEVDLEVQLRGVGQEVEPLRQHLELRTLLKNTFYYGLYFLKRCFFFSRNTTDLSPITDIKPTKARAKEIQN